MSEEKVSWQEVVDRNPKGCVELNNGSMLVYGPIESITITETTKLVCIRLKWKAVQRVTHPSVPNGGWIKDHDNEQILFPDGEVPYIIEDTPDRGERVRFNNGRNFLYFEAIDILDPSKVRGLRL